MRKYFSIIIGAGCNADCPFCIAPEKMKNSNSFDLDDLRKAADYAITQGAAVASVSGGGEPLLLERIDPERWAAINSVIRNFPKRDLHSNYSFLPRTPLNYTDLTVSLWPDRETTRAYYNRDFHNKICDNLRKLSHDINLRLSSVLGSDWCRGPEDLLRMIELAKDLGAKQVTFREMQPGPYNQEWQDERRFSGETAESWLSNYEVRRTSLRNIPVFEVNGVEVMVYRYARQNNEDDNEFIYFRPSLEGDYGIYTDYSDDSKQVIL